MKTPSTTRKMRSYGRGGLLNRWPESRVVTVNLTYSQRGQTNDKEIDRSVSNLVSEC